MKHLVAFKSRIISHGQISPKSLTVDLLSKTGVISMVAVPEGVRHMMLSEELAITARGPFGVKVLHERHQIHEPLLAVHSMLIVGKTRHPYVFTFILEVVRPNSEYPFLLRKQGCVQICY